MLPPHLKDENAFRLVRPLRLAAHPVSAPARSRTQVLLGLQRGHSINAADADRLPAQPEVADLTHPGAAQEPGHLVHARVHVPGVPGCVSQPRPGLLVPEAPGVAGISGQEDCPRDHAGPQDPAEDTEPLALSVSRPARRGAQTAGAQQ